jgi:CheY-like chemotaxis protein
MKSAFTDGMPNDVLIVEDDPIIALDFEETIRGLGVKMVRTVASVARALQVIAEQAPDFALLDVGLAYEKSYAVAERLQALKVPFAFVTGYSTEVKLPTAFANQPRLPKPFTTEALQAALQQHTGDGV